MSGGTDLNLMTPAARMDEVSMLLSMAMMRLWLKRRAHAGGGQAGAREFSQVGEDCLELPRRTSPDGLVHFQKE